MNNLRDLGEYKEAITETAAGWLDIGVGFTQQDTPQNLTSLSRQLNTLLYSVIQLRREVAQLREEVRNTPKEALDITTLTNQLRETHLSQQGAAFKNNKGKIKVFKNPFDLLKEIK